LYLQQRKRSSSAVVVMAWDPGWTATHSGRIASPWSYPQEKPSWLIEVIDRWLLRIAGRLMKRREHSTKERLVRLFAVVRVGR